MTILACTVRSWTNATDLHVPQNYYAPQIFENLGLSGTDTGLFATGVYGVVKFVACGIFLLFVADSLGRRRSLLWTSIAQGVLLFIIGVYGRVQPPVEGEPVRLETAMCDLLF